MQNSPFYLKKAKNSLKWFGYKAFMTYWTGRVDGYLVGYPKTGTTWFTTMLRRMLINYYDLPEETFKFVVLAHAKKWSTRKKLPSEIPVIYKTHNLPGYWSETQDGIRLYMTPFKEKKVILLIRNPKDTLVSLYFHNVYRRVPPVFQGNLTDMVYDKTYGIESFICYYKTWYEHRTLFGDLLLIRYEDHRADPAKMVRDTAQFLGIENLMESTVEDVVAFSSFDNMKNMEKNQKKNKPSSATDRSSSKNAFKVRKGKIGGYKDYLDEKTIHYIDELVAKELPAFYGYPERT